MATPPDFSTGQVLTAAQINAVGLWLVKTQTIGSAVSSVTVTGAFSATYDAYKIIISGGAGSTNITVAFKLGASGTGYYQGRTGITYSTGAISPGADNNTAQWGAMASANTSAVYGNIEIVGPFLAKHTFASATYTNGTAAVTVFAEHSVATSYSDFTLTCSTGTLTGGTIRVYGLRN